MVIIDDLIAIGILIHLYFTRQCGGGRGFACAGEEQGRPCLGTTLTAITSTRPRTTSQARFGNILMSVLLRKQGARLVSTTPGVCDEVVLTSYVHYDVAHESGRRFALLQVIRQEVTKAWRHAPEQRSPGGKRGSAAMRGRSVAAREDYGGADGRRLWPKHSLPRGTGRSASARKPEGCQSSHV